MANIKSIKQGAVRFRQRVDCQDGELSFCRTDAPTGEVKSYSIRVSDDQRSFEIEFSPEEWADVVKAWV
jgi:hypothetical protein